MPTPDTFLLHDPPSGDTHVVRVRDGVADSIATFSSRGGADYAGLAYVLFDPADSSLPWRRGDVLVASSSGRFGAVGRSLIRLRRQFVGRQEVYVSEVIFSDSSSSPIRALSFDPFGALYFSETGSRLVRRFSLSRNGELGHAAWAQVPSALPWQGDFALSPDGYLCVSSGAGSYPGRIFKISLCADPDPDDNAVQTVEYKKAFEWSQADIEGFSFFDGGRVLFGSSDGSFYGASIYAELNPRTPPGGTIQPIVPTLPTITFPPPPPPDPVETFRPTGFADLHVTDLAVARVAWEQYLDEHANVAAAVQWIRTSGVLLPYSQWDDDPTTPDFRRLLHRFYAFRRAGRPAPLTYRRQTEPDGKQRLGPETYGNYDFIQKRDAVETYLAYLAHTLWMEIAGKVSWALHDYAPEELNLLVNAGLLFEPRDWSQAAGRSEFDYRYRPEPFGDAFPSDPYEAFRFINGEIRPGETFLAPELLGGRRASIYRLLRWGRDHIRHHPEDIDVRQSYEYWGYSGAPPLESTYLRRPKRADCQGCAPIHWAWPGCRNASSFFSLILRLMQIPARPFHSYLGDSIDKHHHGLDVPSERLLILHLDQVYRYLELQAMWADPAVLAEPDEDTYEGRKELYQSMPISEEDRRGRNAVYDRLMAGFALKIVSHRLLKNFWIDYQNADGTQPVNPATLWDQLRVAFGLSHTEAWNLANDPQVVGDFIAKIEEILQDLEAAADLPVGLSTADRLEQGLSIYNERHQSWARKEVDVP